jgi:hypothetical protein
MNAFAQLPEIVSFENTTINGSAGCDLISVDAREPFQEIELSRFKRRALQSVAVSSGHLHDVGDNMLNSTFLDVSIGSGIPLGSFDNILGVTPRVRVDWLDATAVTDVPDELYQFELQFFYRRPISERLSGMLILSPSVRSDLTTSDNAFRVFALGLLNWECVPERLTVSGGFVYLGRADLPVLPALGLSWTPSRFTRLDLQFPRSKLSRRLAKNGGESELWSYLTAGLGGNTWAVTRANQTSDELSLRDLRLVAGIERLLNGGGGWFAEAGYANNRTVEYENDESSIDLDDAVLVSAGWRY